MLESILKIVFGVMLVVLYAQRILMPQLGVMQEKQSNLTKLELTLKNYHGVGKEKETKRLKIQNYQIQEGFKVLESYLPYLNSDAANVEQKFNQLKSTIPGKWEITKNSSFQTEDMLVKWPYKLQFDGLYPDAIKVMSFIEGTGQIAKVKRMKISGLSGKQVRLSADLELLFLKSDLRDQGQSAGGIK